jgi:sulfite exporter TauE/SafE
MYVTKTPEQRNRYLQGRFVSYSLAGGVFGGLGEALRKILEIEILGVVAFFIFVGLTLSLFLIWLGRNQRWFRIPSISKGRLAKIAGRSSFLHGILSVALPCSLLYQVFGLSALSNSVIGGFLIGSAHATASTPSFWLSSRVVRSFQKRGAWPQRLLKGLLVLLLFFNLFFFAGKLLYKEETARGKILFCL